MPMDASTRPTRCASTLRSRPSTALTATTLLIVLIGLVLPFTPLATWLGFTALPFAFFIFLIVATNTYLVLVELFKRRLMKRLLV
jgi:P-type Mg2+ transporter